MIEVDLLVEVRLYRGGDIVGVVVVVMVIVAVAVAMTMIVVVMGHFDFYLKYLVALGGRVVGYCVVYSFLLPDGRRA